MAAFEGQDEESATFSHDGAGTTLPHGEELGDEPSLEPRTEARPGVPVIRVGTKCDLIDSVEELSRCSAAFDVVVSTRTGEGLEGLLARLSGFLAARFDAAEPALLTRSRHRNGLERCRAALLAALAGEGLGLEVRAEELRRATDALGRITGAVGVEDLLDVIFREFCIGK
jgi:tRNA modification GTPase